MHRQGYIVAYLTPANNAKVIFSKEKLLISAQGSLFTVQALSVVSKGTKTSVARDHRKWVDAQLVARKVITQFCTDMNTASPTLPFYVATPRNVDMIAGQLIQRSRVGHSRGAICEFSRRSRSRLLRVGARLRADAYGVMATFTYRENMRDHALAKHHLQLLAKWIIYHYPAVALLWRLEYQDRGAIHFHILCMNTNWIDASAITEYWQKLTGDESYPDLKRLRSRRKVMGYISKYIAKMDQAVSSNGFINVPYLENFVGRFWGIINRKCLPLAPLHLIYIRGSAQLLFNMRRYARRKWRFLSKRLQGFSLFVGDSTQWMRLAEYELMRRIE